MNAQRCGQDMTERRKSQNFQSLPHYLTESVWHSLECDSREKAAMSLWQHAWKLGMRCPSEMTFSVVYNLLVLTKSEKKDLSMFEQRTFLQHLKKEWKKFKGLKKAEDFQYADYVEILPMEVKRSSCRVLSGCLCRTRGCAMQTLAPVHGILFNISVPRDLVERAFVFFGWAGFSIVATLKD